MKKVLLSFLLTLLPMLVSAQTTVLNSEGYLYCIPSIMTKNNLPYLYTKHEGQYKIYDGDFNVIKTYDSDAESISYSERTVRQIRKMDPETKELLTDWTIVEDKTEEKTITDNVYSFRYTVDNFNSSESIHFTQTLFDDDDEFEFVRTHYEVIPINMKSEDYYREHSTDKSNVIDQVSPDEFWREYGATGYYQEYDEEKKKTLIYLEKEEVYGGIYNSGLEIVSIDGVVKGKFPSVPVNLPIIYYRGNFYAQRHESGGFVLFRLNATKREYTKARGDLNADGKVNVADHVELSKIILNQ